MQIKHYRLSSSLFDLLEPITNCPRDGTPFLARLNPDHAPHRRPQDLWVITRYDPASQIYRIERGAYTAGNFIGMVPLQ